MPKRRQKKETDGSLKVPFTIFFGLVILVIIGILAFTSYEQFKAISNTIGNEFGIPLTRRASAFVNGDDFEQLARSLDSSDPFYEQTRKSLLTLCNDSNAVYLYTMVPVSENTWRFIIDGSVSPGEEGFSPIGADEDVRSYVYQLEQTMKTQEPVIGNFFPASNWGGWVVSTFSPIVNSRGESVGIIGADYSVQRFIVSFWKQISLQLILIAGFFIIAFVIYFIMISRMEKQRKNLIEVKRLMNAAKAMLEIEHNTLTVMQDNLSIGIFLMADDFIIQASYSLPLETILCEENLEGKNFIDILASSLTEKECDALKNYFKGFFDDTYNAAVNSAINPIIEFEYTSISTNEKKFLRCQFTLIEHGEGIKNILAVISDISVEHGLEIQHAAEENARQNEMNSLFEVIRVDPKLFSEFIEDMEYEFDKITETLKKTDVPTYEMLIDAFQSVHEMKLNAIVLGFSNFANRFQELETKIETLGADDKILFSDVLDITFELNNIRDEKNRFEAALNKIRAFKAGGTMQESQGVLIGNLTLEIEKTAAELDKKARLVVEQIDRYALTKTNRRVIREILVQLVRNAVFHGIESPEMRKMLGKDETGIISLSITSIDKTVHITLSDDGRGLDFDEIKQKAISRNLLKKTDGEIQQNDLIQLIFTAGFSTEKESGIFARRGIGLNLVKHRIVEAKGAIKLQSHKDKGVVFSITLPLDDSDDRV